MNNFYRLAFLSILLLSGCNDSVNLEAEQQALLKTDIEWSASIAEGDPAKTLSYWTSDIHAMMSGMDDLKGKDAVKAMVEGSMQDPNFTISWKPDEAVVFESGKAGYTRGTNQITFSGPEGKVINVSERYLTLWRKEADGKWRCFMEMTNKGKPPQMDGE